MRTIRHLLIFIPLVFLLIGAAFPTPRGFVNDFAGVLDGDAKQRLDERLTTYERETATEIAIAIFPSLVGRTIEDLAVALFEEWKIGKRDKNNGILIVAAIQDRKVRIEVGYGLEGKVPDAQAGRIIREVITPRFREGKYGEGLEAAVGELIALVGGSPAVAEPPTPRAQPSGSPWGALAAFAAGLLIVAVWTLLAKPRCPRCGARMKLVDDQKSVRTAAGPSRWLFYECPMCGYQDRRLQATGRGGSGWGTGGFFSGAGGFGGFGGGLSGGGGASGGW